MIIFWCFVVLLFEFNIDIYVQHINKSLLKHTNDSIELSYDLKIR